MTTINLRRGDSFSMALVAYEDSDATVVRNLTGVTVESTMENMDDETLVLNFTVLVTDAAAGEYTISAAYADTDELVLGLWKADVQYTEGTERNSTDMFYVDVIEDVTP